MLIMEENSTMLMHINNAVMGVNNIGMVRIWSEIVAKKKNPREFPTPPTGLLAPPAAVAVVIGDCKRRVKTASTARLEIFAEEKSAKFFCWNHFRG